MTKAERLEAIEKARPFFYRHGRGCLLFLRDRVDDDEDRYSSVEDIKAALAEEPDAVGLIAATIYAVGRYEPPHEAVVIQSIDSVIRVVIVRAENAEDMGGVEFSNTPIH